LAQGVLRNCPHAELAHAVPPDGQHPLLESLRLLARLRWCQELGDPASGGAAETDGVFGVAVGVVEPVNEFDDRSCTRCSAAVQVGADGLAPFGNLLTGVFVAALSNRRELVAEGTEGDVVHAQVEGVQCPVPTPVG